MTWFINYYECPGNLDYRKAHKPVEWSDEWDCTCNDKCPKRNAEMEPVDSEEIEPDVSELDYGL